MLFNRTVSIFMEKERYFMIHIDIGYSQSCDCSDSRDRKSDSVYKDNGDTDGSDVLQCSKKQLFNLCEHKYAEH